MDNEIENTIYVLAMTNLLNKPVGKKLLFKKCELDE